jgi:hypothetical protein
VTSPSSASAESVVVGIDDTDAPGTSGTGRLARALAARLEADDLGEVRGVTRHQLYEGPGVPKTSHNSAAALVVRTGDPEGVFGSASRFAEREHAAGADPGVALLTDAVTAAAVAFAARAKLELVVAAEARRVAAEAGMRLWALAEPGWGVIGALCAAVLRRGGNDGRFVDGPGIRELRGTLPVAALKRVAGLAGVVDEATGSPLPDHALVDTGDWVRPRLVHGRAILVARRHEGRWTNADAHRR